MDNNSQYTYSETPAAAPGEDYSGSSAPTFTPRPHNRKNVRPSAGSRLSKPARVCMWIVGSIAGITIIFTCVLVWIIGLQYLGVIDIVRNDQNDTQPAAGDTYNYYIYDDSLGGSAPEGGILPIPDLPENDGSQPEDVPDENSGEDAQPQSGTPGLGIKITEIPLQFTIDDKYTGGLVLVEIEDYSSFAGTDVKVNDMIVAVEGNPTPTANDLKSFLQTKSVGDEITVTIARYQGGVAATFEVTVNLIAMPE